jgi:hypothetical protein
MWNVYEYMRKIKISPFFVIMFLIYSLFVPYALEHNIIKFEYEIEFLFLLFSISVFESYLGSFVKSLLLHTYTLIAVIIGAYIYYYLHLFLGSVGKFILYVYLSIILINLPLFLNKIKDDNVNLLKTFCDLICLKLYYKEDLNSIAYIFKLFGGYFILMVIMFVIAYILINLLKISTSYLWFFDQAVFYFMFVYFLFTISDFICDGIFKETNN